MSKWFEIKKGPLDIIINSAALISRVTPHVAHEALLGKVARQTGHSYVLPSFANKSFVDFVDHELKAHGIR